MRVQRGILMPAIGSDGRKVFIRQLVEDVAPAETLLVADYVAAVDAAKGKSVDRLLRVWD